MDVNFHVKGVTMEKPSKKIKYIFPIILVSGFVVSLLLLRSVIMKFFLIQTTKSPALINAYESSGLDETSLAREIFNEINRKRLDLGNNPLEWDERIYQAAKHHSIDLRKHKTFSHHNVEGASVSDRLKNQDLFFLVAAENLFMLKASTENIPDVVVAGWMNSPSHRWVIVDRDKFFTHGAVGVTCDNLSCYVTFNCADFIVSKKWTLKPNYYVKVNLNDESFGFQESYPVDIKIQSSSPVDMYFFDSLSHMNAFIKTGSDRSHDKTMNQTHISDRRLAQKDTYLLIKNNSDSITDVSYELIYN
jgi:uncharacterized protein YkwD